MTNPPQQRPLLVYDGDCKVCRHWVARWSAATGERVEYRPFQEVADRFPEIAREEFEKAVHLIELDGSTLRGADAVFHLFDFAQQRRRLLQMVRRVPGFMPIARAAYAFIARHRGLLSLLTRLFWSRAEPRA